MTTITATTTPQTIDTGSGGYVVLRVTGQRPVTLQRADERQLVNPGCQAVISPAGVAVTVTAVSGSTTVDYTTSGGENGVTRTPPTSTAGRVNAAAAGVGAMAFDRTLGKPIWSDGGTWRDAAGTAV